jgi:hypothetical protein
LLAFERSTISQLQNKPSSNSNHYLNASQITSANVTTPSSPKLTPGQYLLDFKQDFRSEGITEEDSRWISATPPDNRMLTCGLVIVKNDVQTGTTKGKGADRTSVSNQPILAEPVIRGNTVSSYWALCREVRIRILL